MQNFNNNKIYLLGQNIAKRRKEKFLSQNELAEILDISREHLAKVETGKRYISLNLLFKFCEKMKIEEKDLFNFD